MRKTLTQAVQDARIDKSFSLSRYEIRCDKCGRFFKHGPGSSWVCVPSTDVNSGEERERCAACTFAYGPCKPFGDYVESVVCGEYTE